MSLMSRYHKPKPVGTPSAAPLDGNRLFSKKEAAEYMGLTLRRVRTLVTEGTLKIAPGRHKGEKITKTECDRYITSLDRNAIMAPKKTRRAPRRKSRIRLGFPDSLLGGDSMETLDAGKKALEYAKNKQRGREAAAEMVGKRKDTPAEFRAHRIHTN